MLSFHHFVLGVKVRACVAGFDLWFKTTALSGLMLFSATAGQEEFVALQLRNKRPWFMFDPQGGNRFGFHTESVLATDDKTIPRGFCWFKFDSK